MGNANINPLLIAILIALIIQGITSWLPDIPIHLSESDQHSMAAIDKTSLGSVLTGKAQTAEIEEATRIALDAKGYIDSLPFKLSDTDIGKVMNLFDILSVAITNSEKETLQDSIKDIENILNPYWHSEALKNKFIDFEINDSYLLNKDIAQLTRNVENINGLSHDESPGILLSDMGEHTLTYYRALNNVLRTYKNEIEKDQIMVVHVLPDDSVNKDDGTLTQSPKTDYTAFLISRAFEITNKDMNDLYYDYEKLNGPGGEKYIQIIHKRMNKYWFDKEVIESMIPFNTYSSTVFSFLSDSQVEEITALKKSIDSSKEDDGAARLIGNMIRFNAYLGQALSDQYKNVYKSYDLNIILSKKGVSHDN